jgi:hypothetical protein
MDQGCEIKRPNNCKNRVSKTLSSPLDDKNLMQEVEEVAAAYLEALRKLQGLLFGGRSCGENKSVATGH